MKETFCTLIVIVWAFTSPLTQKWVTAEERVYLPTYEQIEDLKHDPRALHVYQMINEKDRGEDLKSLAHREAGA